MKAFYNTTIEIQNLTQDKYDMLIDFLEDNNVTYEETDFEEFEIDERSEEEKYEDWLSEQVNTKYDESRIE